MSDPLAEGERYSVEAADGRTYGPVDEATLRKWASEGRLAPHLILIEQSTGRRFEAKELADLFPAAAPVNPPPAHSIAKAPPVRGPGNPGWGGSPAGPGVDRDPGIARKSGVPPWVVGVVVGGFLCMCCLPLTAILLPAINGVRAVSKRGIELDHMRQLGAAMAQYAEDHDDRFPLNMSSTLPMRDGLARYAQDLSIFRTVNPAGGEILGNSRLAGREAASVELPEQVVLLFDSEPWPDEREVAAFADYHVSDDFSFNDIQRLVDTAPTFRPTPP